MFSTSPARGSAGRSLWQLPSSGGWIPLEVAAPLEAGWRRKVKVRVAGREIARFPTPNGQQPWVEYVLPSYEHQVLLVLVWEPGIMSVHVFMDGLNLRDGVSLEEWRTRAPKPMDRYEQNVIHGWVLKQTGFPWPLLGIGLVIAARTNKLDQLPLAIAVAIGVTVVCVLGVWGWMKLTKRFALWLMTKRTWHDGLRAEAVFLFTGLPLIAIFAIGIIATAH